MQVVKGRRTPFCDVANSLLQLWTPCRLQRICSYKINVIFEIFVAFTIKKFFYSGIGRRVTTGVSEGRAASIFSSYTLQIEAARAPETLYVSTKLHDTIPEINYLQKRN